RGSPRNVRRTVVRATGASAPCNRRDDGEVVAVLQRLLEPGAEPNVFVVPVDVDELPELAFVVIKTLAKAGVFLIQRVQRLGDVARIDLDDSRPASELAQRAGHANFDRHVVVIIGSPPALTLPARGGGQGGGPIFESGGAGDVVLLASLRHEVVDG